MGYQLPESRLCRQSNPLFTVEGGWIRIRTRIRLLIRPGGMSGGSWAFQGALLLT